MIITLVHFKSIPRADGKHGYCNTGGRKFFSLHGMDWREFRKKGLPEEAFLKTGDAMALKLVEFAYGR
ncbi:MAG: hypothetical protein DRJ61_05190 [Acidobacteria bacterium]|nr:MAG: hypothetical protein DRJ61_05190 [Acidobacteriota bacterium]